MITGTPAPDNMAAQLDYYKTHYAIVELVVCTSCEHPLCFELQGNTAGLQTDDRGIAVVPVSERMLSHRVRLDKTDEGKPMVGYQCICGNDTRLGKIEQGLVPVGNTMGQVAWTPFQRAAAAEAINASGKRTKVKVKAGRRHLDTFTVERIKG
mgnify:CR=1 FL=1